MSFRERMNYASFLNNKEFIENKCSKQWGDRINELVFIEQDIPKETMTKELENCLLQDNELSYFEQNRPFVDPFPKNILI